MHKDQTESAAPAAETEIQSTRAGEGKLRTIQSHTDWYVDGVEDNEQLWRLDTLPPLYCQIQLFAEVSTTSADPYENEPGVDSGACFTGNFRLFNERDERDPSGEHRIFYAGEQFEINHERAMQLLLLNREAAEMYLEEEILAVMKLADDPAYHF